MEQASEAIARTLGAVRCGATAASVALPGTGGPALALPGRRPRIHGDCPARLPLDREQEIHIRSALTLKCPIDLAVVGSDLRGEVARRLLASSEVGGEGVRSGHKSTYTSPHDDVSSDDGGPMTTKARLASSGVAAKETVDLKTRLRVAANLRYLKHRHEFTSDAAMGKRLGVSRGAVNRYLKGERTAGLDFLLLVHRRLHVSLDWLVDTDPAPEWFDPEYEGPSR